MLTKQCIQCSKTFKITDTDLVFYEKIDVPEPTQCPKCRLIRRLLERNARVLYKRKCDFSGKIIISQFHEKQPFPVYDQNIWWSDKWEALDYGREIDWTRLFFKQFQELSNVVPHMSVFIIGGTLENSDYTNCTGYLKDCYLVSEADYNENCYYSNRFYHSKDLVDCSEGYQNELCYECIDCSNCYQTFYSQESKYCLNSYFLYNCQDCKDCIGCINQRHKQYLIFNKQYSQIEYERLKQEFKLDVRTGIEQLRVKSQQFFVTQIYKHLQVEKNVSSFGDHLYQSNNAQFCFDGSKLENCKYCTKILEAKDCMDHTSWGIQAELTYQCAACGDHINNMKFCSTCTTNLTNCEYCYSCVKSSDLFGCVGLTNKQYCILNKQYAKEDYFILKEKLIQHMKKTGEYGEFFPLDSCPFAYNETIAMDYFPLTKSEALQQGYHWYEEEKNILPQTYKLADSIAAVNNDILDNVLVCTTCGKNYKIIKQEFDFYKKLNIPVPNKCYTCRHLARIKLRNPIELWRRQCMCTQPMHQHQGRCTVEFETNFAPDRKEIVYCEQCYNKEIY
ncbi:MAG: hypothetical protein WC801_02900 [Patescibacteria group bacterium]|jgi:hypothetical protein